MVSDRERRKTVCISGFNVERTAFVRMNGHGLTLDEWPQPIPHSKNKYITKQDQMTPTFLSQCLSFNTFPLLKFFSLTELLVKHEEINFTV